MQYLTITLWCLAVVVFVIDFVHALARTLREIFKLRREINEAHWSHPNEYKGLYKHLYCGKLWKFKPFVFFLFLTLLFTTVHLVLNPVFFWPRLGIQAVKRWLAKRNYVPPPPPLVYTNMVNGILAAVRSDDYEKSKVWHNAAVLDGRLGQSDHVRVSTTFLFRHKVAKLDTVDLQYFSGWLSDFQGDIAIGCRVEERKDIYVPLVHKKTREQDRKNLSRFTPRDTAMAKVWLQQIKDEA